MKTSLHLDFSDTSTGQEAEAILRSCVHCGFCNATCPTYQLLGDERDGPRGRIYLIKQLLESGSASDKTRSHLDRCLSCRSCETTCPSGVNYGRLLDIGRYIIEQQTLRPWGQRALRRALLLVLPYSGRFMPLLRLAQFFRPVLPVRLRKHIPEHQKRLQKPEAIRQRLVVALAGCVQPAATPNTNIAAARVLDRLGISLLEPQGAGCCGAMSHHMSEPLQALDFARRNIDAWWPEIERGAEAVVITASGCGAMVKDYGSLLMNDPEYADKAARVSEIARDLSEVIAAEDLAALQCKPADRPTAVHCPCSMQHAQKLPTTVDDIFTRAGIEQAATTERHLCCGSAGTYSMMQPAMSEQLLDSKIAALTISGAQRIATANVGCQMHLASKSPVPVQHWIEMLDEVSS